MSVFLSAITGKLADRWVGAVLAPGALLVAAIVLANRLGQRNALDLARLQTWINTLAGSPAAHSPGALLLSAAGVLAASLGAGLAAAALGNLVQRASSLPGRRPPTAWLRAWRLRRWTAADRVAQEAVLADFRAKQAESSHMTQPRSASATPNRSEPRRPSAPEALARRDAICLAAPARPTWSGDRLRVTDLRVFRTYGLDLTAAWPRLWSLASDGLRADLAAAHTAFTAAGQLIGWAILYLAVGLWWWPSLVIAVVTGVSGWIRLREAVGALADLVESAADLHGTELAQRLGLACPGTLTPDVGEQITALAGK